MQKHTRCLYELVSDSRCSWTRCRAMMKMWKLFNTDVCDYGERQNMSHLMTCGDASNCTWTELAFPTIAGVNCAKHWEESI